MMETLFGKLAVGVIGVGTIISGLLINNLKGITHAIPNEVEPQIIQSETFLPAITKEQEFWLAKLRNCESGNNSLALNKVDKNGRSSKSLYQFQDKTWRHYIQKYDLWNWREWDNADYENAIWDGWYQEMVIRKMLNDKNVNFKTEFPTCIKRLGLPPK